MMTAPMATGHAHPIVRPRVHVALLGPVDDLPDIGGGLPRRWGTVRHADLNSVGPADLLVIGGATPTLVATARRRYPGATIIAVIAAHAPTAMLVAMMQAGADACVRAGTPGWLADQVLGTHRRRLRWTRVGGRSPVESAA